MALIDSSIAPFVVTFLFIFAIIYFLLKRSKFTESKEINVVMAGAIALFAASFQPLVLALQGILPIAVVFLSILFAIFFLRDTVKALTGESTEVMTTAAELAVALLLVGVLWDDVKSFLPSSVNPNNVLWVVGLAIIILMFYVINRQKQA